MRKPFDLDDLLDELHFAEGPLDRPNKIGADPFVIDLGEPPRVALFGAEPEQLLGNSKVLVGPRPGIVFWDDLFAIPAEHV
jgi:hypothetical protein